MRVLLEYLDQGTAGFISKWISDNVHILYTGLHLQNYLGEILDKLKLNHMCKQYPGQKGVSVLLTCQLLNHGASIVRFIKIPSFGDELWWEMTWRMIRMILPTWRKHHDSENNTKYKKFFVSANGLHHVTMYRSSVVGLNCMICLFILFITLEGAARSHILLILLLHIGGKLVSNNKEWCFDKRLVYEPFANNLTVTLPIFCIETSGILVAYGWWWAAQKNSISQQFELWKDCDHDKINEGAFLWGEYGIGVDFGEFQISWFW